MQYDIHNATGQYLPTFKEYCKFLLTYRKNDIGYTPTDIRFAEIVCADRSFPKCMWHGPVSASELEYYKDRIIKYIEKDTYNLVKERFQFLFNDYIYRSWTCYKYYEDIEAKKKRRKASKTLKQKG